MSNLANHQSQYVYSAFIKEPLGKLVFDLSLVVPVMHMFTRNEQFCRSFHDKFNVCLVFYAAFNNIFQLHHDVSQVSYRHYLSIYLDTSESVVMLLPLNQERQGGKVITIIFSSPMHKVQGELLYNRSHFVRRPSVVHRASSTFELVNTLRATFCIQSS